MSNAFIGLKQADGSFYPILEDGIADNKKIHLTTVRDDQTTVKINLYKKDTDSIDEPEYVDTLLIENLIPHPKTEPTIHLNVNLDENNILTAEVSDPETGNKSDIRVSMVTLPKEELDAEPDFTLSDSEADLLPTENSSNEDFILPADISFDMPDFDADTQDTPVSEDISLDIPDPQDMSVPDGLSDMSESADTAESPDFDLGDFEMPEDLNFDMETSEIGDIDNIIEDSQDSDTVEESASSDLDLGDFEIPEFDAKADNQSEPEDLSLDMPEPDMTAESTPASEDLSFDMPEESSEEMSFDMPDFGEDDAFASSSSEELSLNEEASLGEEDFSPSADSGFEDLNLDTSDDTSSSMSFDMPDIDDFSAETEHPESEDITPSFDMPEDNASFSMPDEDMSFDIGGTPSFDTEADSSFDMPSAQSDLSQPNFDAGFDDEPEKQQKKKFGFGRKKQTAFSRENPPLYDRNLPDDIDASSEKRGLRISVIICIICAILCILAVIGIFLLFPWKKDAAPKAENIVTVEPPSQLQMQPPPEEPAKPEENTIVIVEKETVEKREVVPEKAQPAPEAKPQAVRYRIKWGDTLWDLSDTYYRNPWLYPIIARENKIKNPDVIIAGTYIMIPPR